VDGSIHHNCQFEVDTFWDAQPVKLHAGAKSSHLMDTTSTSCVEVLLTYYTQSRRRRREMPAKMMPGCGDPVSRVFHAAHSANVRPSVGAMHPW